MGNQKLEFGSATVEYTVFLKNRKSLNIKVYPDSSVVVDAPLGTSLEVIREKVKKRTPWILKQQREFLSYQPLTPERLFVNGETHLYHGRQYKLRIEHGEINEVKLFRGRLVVYHKKDLLPKTVLNSWYKEKAALYFKEALQKALPLFKNYGLSNPEIQMRYMVKRWGSCTPNGKIILNPELIKAPKASIDYVVIHELCHLVHHNHNKAFYELQSRMMPDWKKWKEKLEYSLS